MNDPLGGSSALLALAGAGLLLLVDLILSIFLAAESALSRVALHRLAVEDERGLGFLERLHGSPSSHRAAALILRQFSLLAALVLITATLRSASWRFPVAAAAALTALIGVILVELLLARVIALWNPRRAIKLTAPLIRFANVLLYPVVRPLRALWVRMHQSQQLSDEAREEEQEEAVEALIEVGEREGLLEAEEGEMMRGIVDLDEKLVREIMTPRTDILALPAETLIPQARRTFLDAGHSRLPIFHGSIDNVVGVLHFRDLFQAWEEGTDSQSISRFIRPATFVPETLSAAELLSEMRQKTQLAIVVDE
ncbi:unnamed protein product, partial [marine sediment metagenome]